MVPAPAAGEGVLSPPIRFEALEYGRDGSLRAARFELDGDADAGWQVRRDGVPWLALGPGYELLRVHACGVCSTDLARRHLPFPLPQVIGHEVVAERADGRRCVVEINASHRARGLAATCAFCSLGLETHCPERLVLGIHDLPGGFGPFVLAPVSAVLPLPDALPSSTAVLVEPFAAALHAVETLRPRAGDTVAVLGPRRLGLLVIAALAAWRERQGIAFRIAGLARRAELLARARALGADEEHQVHGDGSGLPAPLADVVVDTTGHPGGLALALRLAAREVHLKSTHGQPAAGLQHATELVVDELALEPLPDGALPADLSASPGRPRIAWLAADPVPAWLAARADVTRAADAAAALAVLEQRSAAGQLPRADAAVAATPAQIDAAVRPRPDRQIALVRPRGRLWLAPAAACDPSPLMHAIAVRGLRLSTSRCGSFAAALDLLANDARLRTLGETFVTHRFPAHDLARAFAVAATPACVKAVVEQGVAAENRCQTPR